MTGPVVGVDVGGTSIRAAVATGPGSYGRSIARPAPAAAGPGAVLDAVAAAAREVAGAEPAGLAVGLPGPLDPESGVVYAAPHLAGWVDVPARDLLAERTGAAVVIRNDADLAGYAEWTAGAARGARHAVFMTVSTGIGGALIIDGALVGGAAGTAGEVGHAPLAMEGAVCGEGHVGCLEGAASGTAIAIRARAAVAAGEPSALADAEPGEIDAAAVARAAAAGDVLARRLFGEAGRALGRAIGGLINLLGPEVVVVGGGLINAGDLLFAPLRSGVGEIAFAVPARRCRIVAAALGTDAGLLGAVAWAWRCFAEGTGR